MPQPFVHVALALRRHACRTRTTSSASLRALHETGTKRGSCSLSRPAWRSTATALRHAPAARPHKHPGRTAMVLDAPRAQADPRSQTGRAGAAPAWTGSRRRACGSARPRRPAPHARPSRAANPGARAGPGRAPRARRPPGRLPAAPAAARPPPAAHLGFKVSGF